MPKHDAGHGTQIIGFRAPQSELKTWLYAADKNNLSLTQFLVTAVDCYLNPHRPVQLLYREISVPGWVTDGAGNVPQYVNLRLPKETISTWDDACNQYYCTRFALLQQAVNWVMQTQAPRKLIGMVGLTCKNILLNLITTLGLLDFPHIAAIFKDWDPASLAQLLGTLELEGDVMRKGQETYVAASGVDPMLGPRFVAGHLVLAADVLRARPEEWDEMQHALLAQAAVEYLDQYATTLGKNFEVLVGDLRRKIHKEKK